MQIKHNIKVKSLRLVTRNYKALLTYLTIDHDMLIISYIKFAVFLHFYAYQFY